MAEAQFTAVGKRKASVARVILRPGSGQVKVNGRALEDYFLRPSHRTQLQEPLKATSTDASYDALVTVSGGGLTGQAGAVRLGIARALLKSDEEHKAVLRKSGFLTRDARVKERKKFGRRGARRGFQHSKR